MVVSPTKRNFSTEMAEMSSSQSGEKSGLRYRGTGSALSEPSSSEVFARKVKSLDLYQKLPEDLKIQTAHGGFVSIVMLLVMFLMVLAEFRGYMSVEVVDQVVVDTMYNETLVIALDVEFPHLQCDDINIYLFDKQGDRIRLPDPDVGESSFFNVDKTYTGQQPDPMACPGCPANLQGAPGDNCCGTCETLRHKYIGAGLQKQLGEALRSDICMKERGCRVHGSLSVKKVSGKLFLTVGEVLPLSTADQHHKMGDLPLIPEFDATHTVHKLLFGEEVANLQSSLDGQVQLATDDSATMFSYFIKLVPTSFTRRDGSRLLTYQYAVTDVPRHVQELGEDKLDGLPGVALNFEINPFMVNKEERTVPLSHLISATVAILGGVFSVAKILNVMVASLFGGGRATASV